MFKLVSIILLVVVNNVNQAAALELSGELQQGAMIIGKVDAGSNVWLDEKPLQVNKQGLFVFGLDRDASASMTLKVSLPDGEQQQQQLSIAARNYKIQRIEGISKKIMNPSTVSLTRIREEAAQVRQSRATILERIDFAGTFNWPLIGPISGVYGSQRVYNGVPKRPHYGVDVAAPVGTPLTTPAPGEVTLAHPDMFYSGGTIIIDHGFGISSTLMHLSKVLVKVGQKVVPGDIVGEVGAGGRATGPHLDWRMNWFKARIDPQLLVVPMAEAQTLKFGSIGINKTEKKHDR